MRRFPISVRTRSVRIRGPVCHSYSGNSVPEPLEPRQLLAVTPVGPEFVLGGAAGGIQQNMVVSVAHDGTFVAVWDTGHFDPVSRFTFGSVYGRRYDAAGVAVGDAFLVSNAGALKSKPSVAVDAAGGFVVAWLSTEINAGSFATVYARRYGANGAPLGGEVRVNVQTAHSYYAPGLAVDADGDFVVAWDDIAGEVEGTDSDVLARRFSAAGVARGGPFRVNPDPAEDQSKPSVAMDADGDFVVVWDHNTYLVALDESVFGRRYNAAGVAQGGAFRVDGDPGAVDSSRSNGRVAMNGAGEFSVAWVRSDAGIEGPDVYARRYSASGVARGPEFRVNTTTAGFQTDPVVAMNDAGDLVVAWSGTQVGAQSDVYARWYDGAGKAQGNEFRVNATEAGNQISPSIGIDADSDLLAAWDLYGGRTFGDFARRFRRDSTPPAAPEAEVRGNNVVIADGDTTPVRSDHTDFGSTSVAGGTITRTFTVRNTGTAPLNLTGATRVVVAGTNAGDFKVVAQPAAAVAPGASTTFKVRFDPSKASARSATLSLATNDANENPYNFTIRGIGNPAAPPAPATLAASVLSASQVRLKWQNVSGETGYRVERSTDGVNFSFLANVADEVTTFTDSGLRANTRYFYRVGALNGATKSGPSPTALVVTAA
jgi:hypothetical protein